MADKIELVRFENTALFDLTCHHTGSMVLCEMFGTTFVRATLNRMTKLYPMHTIKEIIMVDRSDD